MKYAERKKTGYGALAFPLHQPFLKIPTKKAREYWTLPSCFPFGGLRFEPQSCRDVITSSDFQVQIERTI